MIEQRPGQKVFTVPGPERGIRVIQPAAAEEYYRKVLGYGPIAYWPIWDPLADPVAEELVNSPAQDGAHTAVTLGQPGIGDGRTSGWYNGPIATSITNVWSAPFQAAFDGSEVTVIIWARVNDIGVWTDGIARRLFNLRVDGNNRMYVSTTVGGNALFWAYIAGGVARTVALGGLAELNWMCAGITCTASVGTGEMRAYYNGIQTGLTQVALGAWAGLLDPIRTVIGDQLVPPPVSWHGWEAHCVIFDYAVPPAGMWDLAQL